MVKDYWMYESEAYGGRYIGDDDWLDNNDTALEIQAKLIPARLNLLRALLDPIKAFLEEPVILTPPECHWHLLPNGPHESLRVKIKQALSAALYSQNLFPLPEPEQYQASVLVLMQEIQGVIVAFNKEIAAGGGFGINHYGCNPINGLQQAIDSAYYRRPFLICDDDEYTNMAGRRATTGGRLVIVDPVMMLMITLVCTY